MLHLTSEEIYEICFVKKETLSLQNVEDELNGKIFNIQIKRLFTKKLDATQKLSILSYVEKQDVIHKSMTSTTVNITDAKKRTIEQLISTYIIFDCFELQLKHFCCDSRNSHFLHSSAAATVCRVLQPFDVAMWMPYVPVLLQKLKIFSPII
ncbi:hypothetical protein H5410_059973, partial [Solanum commersonii]